jgi:hypothetical protein
MRTVSDITRELIESAASLEGGGFQRTWVADLMYDGDRRLQNLLIEAPRLEWDASRFVVASGSCRIVWADDQGTSMIPRQIGDWFSPFGAELQIDCLIGAGEFVERVPMGRLVIEDVPDAVEASLLFQGVLVHPGESFTVNLRDRLVKTARDQFAFPTAPSSTSAWGEAQAITGLPVVRNVPDAVVPGSVTYEGQKDEALKAIFDVMGAWPHVDPSGVLTARSKAFGAPVGEVRGVVSAPVSLDSAETYNAVVVEGKSPGGDPLYAVAEIVEGFLRVRNAGGAASPFGKKTLRYSSQYLDTQAKVNAYAEELLRRVSRVRGVTRDVVEPFNPLREVGDVLTFRDALVRVRKVSHDAATTRLTVEVPDGE